MKRNFCFLLTLSMGIQLSLFAQKDSLQTLTGLYQAYIDPSTEFIIKKEQSNLILEIPGQGQTDLIGLGSGRFRPNHIPATTISFLRDNNGKARQFSWEQERKQQQIEWMKLPDENKKGYTGRYQLKNDPYKVIWVKEMNGQLSSQVNGGPDLPLAELSADKFVVKAREYSVWYEFAKDKQGNIAKLLTHEGGRLDFDRVGDYVAANNGGFQAGRAFTRADSLRGMLSPLRNCYDVLFYALDVEVVPASKFIKGNTLIRFKATQSFDRMQVDLYANMTIEKIVFRGKELSYIREYNAVFINFPEPVKQGQEEAITIFYQGKPQQPDMTSLRGGFLWFRDKEGNAWIESVCQGSGASLWWPCKDHQSDKPDSMKISITVPDYLTDISNGRLLGTQDLTGGRKRFDWYVTYPINTYNVVINIGKYQKITDMYPRERDSMQLNFYFLPYNLEHAKQVFGRTKQLITLFENSFGEYPFKKDGFTLMESLYPMEHQGAVSIGSINDPFLSNKVNLKELARLSWHEAAHEWWGNSITSKDIADLWIHEAFATYAEVIAYEFFDGKEAALKNLKGQRPGNKSPIIGTYNVNDFRLGDVYPKGCLMLHTLRNIIDNDSSWFDLLKGLQDRFRYQSVSTEDIVGYINSFTQKDHTAFFDQYLRYANIPELELALKRDGKTLEISYKWNTDVKSFNMPVKVTTAKNSFAFIHPTNDWQKMKVTGMSAKDFMVDTEHFYVGVKMQ